MWKITFFCHLTLFICDAADVYRVHVKVTELKIEPNNGAFDYNEETGELKVLTDVGLKDNINGPFYYDYSYEIVESEELGLGTDRVCGKTYINYKGENGHLHGAILQILSGNRRCPFFKGQIFNVEKDFSYTFADSTDGILINCGNINAEVLFTGMTGTENVGSVALTYYLTGPKCSE